MGVDAATPPGLWERVRQIASEEVAKFAKSGFLRNARISGGNGLTVERGSRLIVEHPDGRRMLLAGAYSSSAAYNLPDGSQQPMFLLNRADGSLALSMYDPDPALNGFQQFFALWDRSSNIVLSDDADSGQGIARPYVPGSFYRSRYSDWVGTTMTTFETMFRARIPKQHPRLRVRLWASNDTTGATGEVRVVVNGTQFGPTIATTFSIAETLVGPLVVAGTHMTDLVVEIQARLVTGAGAVRVEPSQLQGEQS